jgi:uncharacterized linocin/CFP29 family protein
VYPKLLAMHGPLADAWATTVPADVIEDVDDTVTVPEGEQITLAEVQVKFALSQAQVEEEKNGLSTAVTLVTRAANRLALGLDTLVWNKPAALPPGVQVIRGKAPTPGLVAGAANKIEVKPTTIDPDTGLPQYGERTFDAVAQAVALLEGLGHARPLGCVVDFRVFADAHRSLANTLITPAERIKPLVPKGFCPTARVPDFTGLVLSSRASTVDHVVGMAATTGYLQANADGTHLFRVFERFTVRRKDPTALVRLEFKNQPQDAPDENDSSRQ